MQIIRIKPCKRKKKKQIENTKEVDTETWKTKNKSNKYQASEILILYSIQMSAKTLKFGNIEVNRKEFYVFKQAIDLSLVYINKIVISDKFKQNDKGFKDFTGFKDDNIVRVLCIILPQMSGYMKYFENGGKICFLWLKMIAHWLNIMKFGTKLKWHQTKNACCWWKIHTR